MNSLEALDLISKTTDLDINNKLGGYHNELESIKKYLEALEIIKRHIRHFKSNKRNYDYMELLQWVHQVEKERGWKL